jgi:hypothetical protein
MLGRALIFVPNKDNPQGATTTVAAADPSMSATWQLSVTFVERYIGAVATSVAFTPHNHSGVIFHATRQNCKCHVPKGSTLHKIARTTGSLWNTQSSLSEPQ